MVVDQWKILKKYAGEWVAMHNNKVVGHGKTLRAAYDQALRVCKVPRVFQVPEDITEVYLL